MPRKERASAIFCGVALLFSASLVNATDIDAKSFRCIAKMTPVRQFYVDNLQGNLDATLAVANSPKGCPYRKPKTSPPCLVVNRESTAATQKN